MSLRVETTHPLIYTITDHYCTCNSNGSVNAPRDIAGHERFGHMTRVYYKYA